MLLLFLENSKDSYLGSETLFSLPLFLSTEEPWCGKPGKASNPCGNRIVKLGKEIKSISKERKSHLRAKTTGKSPPGHLTFSFLRQVPKQRCPFQVNRGSSSWLCPGHGFDLEFCPPLSESFCGPLLIGPPSPDPKEELVSRRGPSPHGGERMGLSERERGRKRNERRGEDGETEGEREGERESQEERERLRERQRERKGERRPVLTKCAHCQRCCWRTRGRKWGSAAQTRLTPL